MLFDQLLFFDDSEPRSGAVNMAVDEALLQEMESPLLRIYRWNEPAVSFGYFGKLAEVNASHPDRTPVRRWTGGGIVPHGDDFTYTLVIPASSPFFKQTPLESYRLIHEHVIDALRGNGIHAELTAVLEARPGAECFANPVAYDISLANNKIAGAAQRRTRKGMLHQGSIQLANLPEVFSSKLANTFSNNVIAFQPQKKALESAIALAETKYASAAWMEKW